MSLSPLLIEIGCEEIPSRMIPPASEDLGRLVLRLLDQGGLSHGELRAWGGSRRLAVRVEDVPDRQVDREELVLGPPAKVAFTPEGRPTAAALGFARKQGIDADDLELQETEKGSYVGFRKKVAGLTVGQLLERELPGAVEAMSFPKTMRWADGRPRWVRPVHWLLALHGAEVLPLTLFGIRASGHSAGHRFLGADRIEIGHPERYLAALEASYVVADPAKRRERLTVDLNRAAAELDGRLVEDSELLEEVADLVEWPGVVPGRFDPGFLDLPRELLVTTLRHHQKCFSVQAADGSVLPGFLAVANREGDPAGHIRRGNEWVVGGRLEDARFFWREDRKSALSARSSKLSGVVFHARLGSYADKAERIEELSGAIARQLGLSESRARTCRLAAGLAKNDLVTETVGEFPELQGQVGGLLLCAEGESEALWRAVYEHYRPAGSEDAIPASLEGRVVALADKLDTTGELIRAGERPTGSRDPLGLRRATSGIFRIVIESPLSLSLSDLSSLGGGGREVDGFLVERFQNFLRDSGATTNEINAVMRLDGSSAWPLHDVVARVAAIRTVRRREDFAHLVDLTKRVDNILTKNSEKVREMLDRTDLVGYREEKEAASSVRRMVETYGPEIASKSENKSYEEIIEILSRFIEPVDLFFEDVLVIDPANPRATHARWELLASLKTILTSYFDIRELAGQAERRS